MTEEQKRLQEKLQQPAAAPAEEQPQVNAAPEVKPAQQQPSVQQQAADTAYNQAMGALQAAGKPTYNASYDAQIKDIFGQIMGREQFDYNINEDALYQMYRDNYANLGKMAMKDTMGQAAALTGGYGSTYGQAVGQQQYNGYLQQLNDVVPELYGQAYQRYQDEGDRLYQQYAILGDLAADEYAKYQDEYNRYYTEQDYNYGRLMALLESTGYEPTAEEAAAAGLTEAQVQQLLKAWRIQHPGLYNQMNGIVPQYRSSGNGGGDNNTGENAESWVEAYNILWNDPNVTRAEMNEWIDNTAGWRPADYEKYYVNSPLITKK